MQLGDVATWINAIAAIAAAFAAFLAYQISVTQAEFSKRSLLLQVIPDVKQLQLINFKDTTDEEQAKQMANTLNTF